MAGVTVLDADAFEAKALATTALERFASMTRLIMTRFWRGGHRITIIGF
jgi:hypothetical protein